MGARRGMAAVGYACAWWLFGDDMSARPGGEAAEQSACGDVPPAEYEQQHHRQIAVLDPLEAADPSLH